MKLCLLYISVATTFLAICISSAQDNEQTVSELTNGMVESEGLVAAHFVALRNIQLNFTNLLSDLFQPNAASLSWFKEEVRYYTEAARLNKGITSIFEAHSNFQKYSGRI
ncbi:unnamed protein product [Heterobilharzia americana]|nr:unnamed protein product [Heterobilharzia americana]